MTRSATATHPGQQEFAWPTRAQDHYAQLRRQCHWVTQDGRWCVRDAYDSHCGLRLCFQHEKVVEGYLDAYISERPGIMQRLYWQYVFEPRLGDLPDPGRGVVYFVERQGFVKIGTSTNLPQRLRDIGKGGQMITGMTVGPVRLVATMPGDHRHEHFLHDRFHTLRVEGEWFLPDDELCQFIRRLPNVNRDLLEEIEIRHGIAEEEEGVRYG